MIRSLVFAFVLGCMLVEVGWWLRGWAEGRPAARHRGVRRWFPPEQPEAAGAAGPDGSDAELGPELFDREAT